MYKNASLMLAAALGFGLMAGLPTGAQAQATATLPAAEKPMPTDTVPVNLNYRLGADDVLSIQVINFPELSVPQVTIAPDGNINVPLLGTLPVTGQTTAELAQTLTQKWSNYVIHPSVTVSLSQRRKESVLLYGYVLHAQPVEYKPDLHLMQALAQAGGGADDGDLSRVTVTHKDGSKQTVDVSVPQSAGGTDQDLSLSPGDVVYVPERTHSQVSILGEVIKPGSYEYKDKMSLLDALKDADNVNLETANLSGTTLLRDGKETSLDLNALLRLGQTDQNITLMAGDRIFIPELHNRIFVDGAVGHPGYYLFQPGDRLLNAITGSGGTLIGASDLAKIVLVHQDKTKNTATVEIVDLARFYRTGEVAFNVPLKPGDVLYIPVKKKPFSVMDAISTLTGVGAVASSARILGL